MHDKAYRCDDSEVAFWARGLDLLEESRSDLTRDEIAAALFEPDMIEKIKEYEKRMTEQGQR